MSNRGRENYCTLFDLGYLPQGLALRESLERHAGSFMLWILCMDKDVEIALRAMDLPSIRLISLAEVETPQLLKAKATRTHGEYCWTLTSFLPKHILAQNESVERITYLDSDLWFINSPSPIFQEFEQSGKHVLYTEHGYSPEYDQSLWSGRFCVQFMTFRNTPNARRVLDWWGERCLEWCYARFENGQFGDQKYLEQFQTRFPDETHLLQRPEYCVAPWNANRFPIGSAIFFHFHGLRIFKNGRIRLWTGYRVPESTKVAAYYRYVRELKEVINQFTSIGVKGRFSSAPKLTTKELWHRLRFRVSSGNFNKILAKLRKLEILYAVNINKSSI